MPSSKGRVITNPDTFLGKSVWGKSTYRNWDPGNILWNQSLVCAPWNVFKTTILGAMKASGLQRAVLDKPLSSTSGFSLRLGGKGWLGLSEFGIPAWVAQRVPSCVRNGLFTGNRRQAERRQRLSVPYRESRESRPGTVNRWKPHAFILPLENWVWGKTPTWGLKSWGWLCRGVFVFPLMKWITVTPQ